MHGDGPLHHGMDALLDAPRCLPLHVPDRGEDLQHVGAGHLGDRPATDAREGVAFQTAPPRRGVCGMTPPTLLLLHHAYRRGGKGWHVLRAALVGQRVAAGPGELTVGACLLPRLGKRDQGNATEAELAAAAADEEPLDPAPRPGGLNEQVQTVAVTMPARRSGADDDRLLEERAAVPGVTGPCFPAPLADVAQPGQRRIEHRRAGIDVTALDELGKLLARKPARCGRPGGTALARG